VTASLLILTSLQVWV